MQGNPFKGQILNLKFFANVLLMLNDNSNLYCYKVAKNGIRLMWLRNILPDDQYDFENDLIKINHDNKHYQISIDDENGPDF